MKEYVFEGYSDDTFGEYNVTNDDYDNCAADEPIDFSLTTPDGAGLLVRGRFGIAGGWLIGVAVLDEEKPVSWPVTLNPAHDGYRNQCRIEAPDDAVLACVTRDAP